MAHGQLRDIYGVISGRLRPTEGANQRRYVRYKLPNGKKCRQWYPFLPRSPVHLGAADR
jgi:hypothetical protein